MIYLIDNYDSFTFNLYQLAEALGAKCRVVRNDAITVDELARKKPKAILLSPGPGAPDSAGVTMRVVAELGKRIPILGVCLGHQAIGQVFGGSVIRARRAIHGKASSITHAGRGLFRGLPSPLQVGRYHSLVVSPKRLPSCLEITASTEDGIIMGLRHRDRPVHGIQFHPESVLTPRGPELLKNFLVQVGEVES
jgi:anthranilate synthase component 2